MRSASRAALLVAALVLPVAVVVGSYALTSGPRAPKVPAQVEVGDSAPSVTGVPTPPVSSTPPPSPAPPGTPPPHPPKPPGDDDLGPPAPEDDDDGDDRDRDDD